MSEPTPPFNAEAYDAAWRWFELHARQRMDLFRFYATVFVALLAAVGILLQVAFYAEALAAALLGLFFCFIFQGLDRRTANLAHHAEEALAVEQERLRATVGYDSIELVKAADAHPVHGRTYGRSVMAMMTAIGAVFVGLAILAVARLAGPSLLALIA